MNIFAIDKDPVRAAQQQCDKHVVKMILESAQLLSTAHRVLDGSVVIGKTKTGRKQTQYVLGDKRDDVLYKATHINHPSAVWCRQTKGNYTWLYMHFKALCKEYTARYGRKHLCEEKLLKELVRPPIHIKQEGCTPFSLAMPEQYKVSDTVESYRKYYKSKVATIDMRWKRNKPEWF